MLNDTRESTRSDEFYKARAVQILEGLIRSVWAGDVVDLDVNIRHELIRPPGAGFFSPDEMNDLPSKVGPQKEITYISFTRIIK